VNKRHWNTAQRGGADPQQSAREKRISGKTTEPTLGLTAVPPAGARYAQARVVLAGSSYRYQPSTARAARKST
jgi:hypothetical protein